MIRRLNITIALVVFAVVSTFAQGKASDGRAQKACAAEVGIEFVRYGKRPSIYTSESDERVWLRFVNQSKKTALTFDAEDSQLTRDFLERKSKELGIYYETVMKDSCDSEDEIVKDRPVGYARREAYHIVTLKPGQSFIFSVARQHLSNAQAIYLSYSVSKKTAKNDKGVEPKTAYFFASQLP